MSEKMVKQSGQYKVSPVGSFIGNLVIEISRRVIRNGERLSYLLDEVKNRFKISPEDMYTLVSELEQLGISILPNEWLYFTPVEQRKAVLQGLIKTAKVHGSRYEDVLAFEEQIKADIQEVKKWIKENGEHCQKFNPQTFYDKMDKLAKLENKLKDVEVAKKLTASTALYNKDYKAGNSPMLLMAFAEYNDGISAILKTADSDIASAPVNELEEKSTVESATEVEPEAQKISLSQAFENLKKDEALKPFFAQFQGTSMSEFDTKEVIESNINGLLETIDNMAPSKELSEGGINDDEELNSAYKAIQNFIEARKAEGIELNTRINDYIDNSIQPDENAPVIGEDGMGIGDQVGQFSPDNTPGGVPPTTDAGIPKQMAYNGHVKTANVQDHIVNAVMFIDKINGLLNDIQTGNVIPKTVHANTAIASIQGSLSNLKHYVQEELPYNTDAEKRAAVVVLSNINKKLSSLIDTYTDTPSETELMKYVVTSDLLTTLKRAKVLLATIGA